MEGGKKNKCDSQVEKLLSLLPVFFMLHHQHNIWK